ncbi:MAG: PilX N-terminal domain-containing pilus assembly protein [Glaciimonas sp.]|nr:PilX N-terminal domain-containing pilus assembly protein [Glaciimonas sp.]
MPIVLIFLTAMTFLTIAAMRNGLLEEKMAANLRSRQLAFEAAEQALHYCEILVQATPASDGSEVEAYPVLMMDATNKGKAPWELPNNWGNDAISIALPSRVLTSAGLAEKPRCMIEKINMKINQEFQLQPDDAPPAFRITARGIGASDKVVVLLQSYLRL